MKGNVELPLTPHSVATKNTPHLVEHQPQLSKVPGPHRQRQPTTYIWETFRWDDVALVCMI